MNRGRLFAQVQRGLRQWAVRRNPIAQWLRQEEHPVVMLGRSSKNVVNAAICLLTIVVLVIDHLTGSLFHFPLTFFLPIGLSTWWYGRRLGAIVTGILMLAYLGYRPSPPWGEWWGLIDHLGNGMVMMMVFLLFVYLLDQLVVAHTALAQCALLHPVNTATHKLLRGFLPICSFCKRIRNEENIWEQIEEYITRHSDAEFSHSICPDCRDYYYRDARKPRA